MIFTLFIDILIAIAFIGVGASIVRSAKPMSGYLMAAGGLIALLTTCCAGFTSRDILNRLELGGDQLSTLLFAATLLRIVAHLTIGILFAISIAGLAKAAKAAKAP